LTPAVIRQISAEPPPRAPAELLGVPRAVGRIGIGDILSIAIFETPPALFSPTVGVPTLGPLSGVAAATAAPQGSGATLTNLPPLQVAGNGTIPLPYGGPLNVFGLTTGEVGKKIEERLKNKSLMPQVVVDVSKNVSNTVFVSGDVKTPGRYPLDLQVERLLDILTLAGGPLNPPFDEVVTVSRGNSSAEMTLSNISALSPYNVLLSPGDRIEVDFKPRTFTVFGSAARISEIDFKYPTLTLAEGLARADAAPGYESDSTGIFLFRLERPAVMRELGLPASRTPVPVIYHIDLMNPTSYALMTQFHMQSKDLVYVASARSVPIQKFMNLIGAMFTPLAPVAAARQLAP
jgi:polysaccharide export outer membrane protein